MDQPHRLVLRTKFHQRPTVSRGIILYARKTQQYLMVRRSQSLEFTTLIRGAFRTAKLPFLIRGLYKNEIEKLSGFLSLSDEAITVNLAAFLEPDDIEFSLKKLTLARPHLIKLLALIKRDSPELDFRGWIFPRGREEIGERDIDNALREFNEEAGLSLCACSLVSSKPVIETYLGTNDRLYETQYWVASIRHPRRVPTPPLEGEICDRRWVSEDEIRQIYPETMVNRIVKLAKRKPKRRA